MASYTCPKCDITLKKGSWELYTNCPDCNEPWVVDPNAGPKNLRRIKILASVFAILSLVPFLGVIFGVMGMFWGYLAVKFRYTVLGVSVMLFSAVIGLVGQPAFSWWTIGQLADQQCNTAMTTYVQSLRAYHQKHGKLPTAAWAREVADEKLALPNGCLYGGKYFYLPPWGWDLMEISNKSPAAVKFGIKVDSKKPEAAIPAAFAPGMPEKWVADMPEEWMAIFKGASVPATTFTLGGATQPATAPATQSATQAATATAAATAATSPAKLVLETPVATAPTTTAAATYPAATRPSLANVDPATVIIVGEYVPVHRYTRTCIFADLSLKVLPLKEYERLLALPQNQVFAKLLPGAKKAKEATKKVSKGGH